MGVSLIVIILLLYVGWVLFNWRTGILLVLGMLLLAVIIAGVVVNTIFLVREIRRNEQHDAFINAVTHELKTPVASIRLYLETLQTRDVDEAKRREFYRIMLADSDRLLGTIEQVLRTGRVAPGSRKLNRSPFDLASVVDSCLARARTQHNLPTEALRHVSVAHVGVNADLDEIQAAIGNLIDNAIKYSGAEVRVEVETAAVDGAFAVVRIRDTGLGIAQSELKQIFKRFYRAPGVHSVRVKGTGLGLFIVRSVAKRHGGRAWAESKGPGQGSTFFLQLPVAK